MKISGVIVTYNRLTLLKECIEAVRNQSCQLYKLFIIDNCSTDGTSEYLDTLSDEQLIIAHLPQNTGGSGGFSHGIRLAVEDGAEAVWIMDDDTVPEHDALQGLCDVYSKHADMGFANSRVIWTDGSDHLMNKPAFISTDDLNLPIREIRHASFVSLLIPSDVVYAVGLPYKDFFIWMDDVEYCMRIINRGYKGLYAANSVAVHKTATNYISNLRTAPASVSWKFYYKYRNSVFLLKSQYGKGLIFYFKYINTIRIALRRISKRPSSEQAQLREFVLKGCHDGLSFNPIIEKIEKQ